MKIMKHYEMNYQGIKAVRFHVSTFDVFNFRRRMFSIITQYAISVPIKMQTAFS